MERARLRALTHHYLSLRKNGPPCKVEMERARLRALTQQLVKEFLRCFSSSRNGESPIKGIDTSADCPDCYRFRYVEMERARLRALTQSFPIIYRHRHPHRRNGESPIKGIDT